MWCNNVLKHPMTEPNASQMHLSLQVIRSRPKVSEPEIRGVQWTYMYVVTKPSWGINIRNLSL